MKGVNTSTSSFQLHNDTRYYDVFCFPKYFHTASPYKSICWQHTQKSIFFFYIFDCTLLKYSMEFATFLHFLFLKISQFIWEDGGCDWHSVNNAVLQESTYSKRCVWHLYLLLLLNSKKNTFRATARLPFVWSVSSGLNLVSTWLLYWYPADPSFNKQVKPLSYFPFDYPV